MPRFIAEGIETQTPVIIKELLVTESVLVQEKEVVVKGTNLQSGTINFVNTKVAFITFIIPFNKIPRVILTPLNQSVTNPFITNPTVTGFTINFQNKWTGALDWIAIERD